MGFCLFANVAIAARHALDSLGAERVLVLDWDVHHGNGTNAVFHDSRRGAVREHPPVAVLSRHGRAARRRARARGRATRSTCRCPPASGEDEWLSLVEHVVRAGGARSSGPTWCWSRPASTPTATTRSAAAARDRVLRRAGARGAALGDELGAPVGARARGRLRPRRAGRRRWRRRWRRSSRTAASRARCRARPGRRGRRLAGGPLLAAVGPTNCA